MKRILIVEDYLDILEDIQERLTERGYEVFPFDKGEDGLEWASKQKYHLAIIDLSLPDISGIEIIRKLKKLNPSVPVWSYSAYPEKPKESDLHVQKKMIDNLETLADEFLKSGQILI